MLNEPVFGRRKVDLKETGLVTAALYQWGMSNRLRLTRRVRICSLQRFE